MFEIFKQKLFKLVSNLQAKGFFHLLSANFMMNVFSFGSQLFVAMFLSSVDLGRIKTMQSFSAIAVIVAGFGFNTAVLKLCSEKRSIIEKEKILAINLRLTIFFVILVLIIIAFSSLCGFLSPDSAINRLMLLFMFTIPAAVFTSLIMCYLQALKRIKEMSYAQVAIRFFGVLGLICCTYYFGLLGFIFSSILIGLFALFPLFRLAGAKIIRYSESRDVVKMSFFYGRWSMASNGLNTLGSSIDLLLLNYFIKDRALIGDYGLATVFILAMNQITGTVQAIATPFFSEKSKDKNEFMRVLNKYQRLLIIVAGLITIVSCFFVPMFIKYVYAKKYVMTGTFFQFLSIRYFFWSCYALLGVALLGLGKMKDCFVASSISVPIVLILSIIFYHFWGAVGVAFAQSVAGFLAMGIVYINFKRVIVSYQH